MKQSIAMRIAAALIGASNQATAMPDIESQRRQWIADTTRPNRLSQKGRRKRARWSGDGRRK